MDKSLLREAIKLHNENVQFCLAVVVGKSGSAPQMPGAMGLFLRDGRIYGTIGGGCLEMEARRHGLEALSTGKSSLHEFKLDDDFGWDDGLICGGRVAVLLIPDSKQFVESFKIANQNQEGAIVFDLHSGQTKWVAKKEADDEVLNSLKHRRESKTDNKFILPILFQEKLIIFGGGHIGRELTKAGASLGFEVTVIDDRPEFVTEERMPWSTNRICENPEKFANQLVTDDDTYLCLVTRGHRNDAKVLKELILKPRAFLGMIGSKRKREVVKKEMVAEGICTEEQFNLVRCPMGLDIGGETVEEIAVSIVAELVQVRAKRRGPVRARV